MVPHSGSRGFRSALIRPDAEAAGFFFIRGYSPNGRVGLLVRLPTRPPPVIDPCAVSSAGIVLGGLNLRWLAEHIRSQALSSDASERLRS